MSYVVTSMVWAADIAPTALKLTALALADWCDDDGGRLFPAMTKVAEKIGVSRSQAQRLMHALVDKGLLSIEANERGGKPGITPQYRLRLNQFRNLPKTGSASATGRTYATGRMDATRRVAPMRQTGSTDATQYGYEPVIEPVNPKATKPKRTADAVEPPHFEAFWEAYPKKVAKAAAVKAFRCVAVDGEALAAMLVAIDSQKLTREWTKDKGQFIPHPATWLNGRRWEDSAATAEHDDSRPGWALKAGFRNRFEASNAQCHERNAHEFSQGRRKEPA